MGTILSGYTVIDKIKDGSVGTVWRATNTKNHVFALKQISDRICTDAGKVRQFRNEALLTKLMNHRYIIKVYEYIPHKPQPFFTMEFFDSENLKYCIFYEPGRVYSHEFYILRQVAEALSYIHSLGVVHRDIKPENVLVAKNSEVRLIDFSLSHQHKWWHSLLPPRWKPAGTPLYMAPEQIRGDRCDARTDIYGFGAMMFEALTKRPPYMGTTEAAMLKKHISEPVPSMRSYVKTINPALDELVQKMLQKKPDDRFQDMTSIIYELSKWEKKDTIIRLKQVEPAKKPNG